MCLSHREASCKYTHGNTAQGCGYSNPGAPVLPNKKANCFPLRVTLWVRVTGGMGWLGYLWHGAQHSWGVPEVVKGG